MPNLRRQEGGGGGGWGMGANKVYFGEFKYRELD